MTAIHSVAGLLPTEAPLIVRPPFCDPHHSASLPAIVGGGSRVARPGAVSLAHRGILFLDEAPEFRPSVLDALRQPLEHGEVVIARSAGTARLPARFQLVIAANPCPCGRAYGKGVYCTCSPQARSRYQHRLSGPDPRPDRRPAARRTGVASRDGRRPALVESTAVVAGRVRVARERQAHRYAGRPWSLNAHVPGYELRRRWPPDSRGDAGGRGTAVVRRDHRSRGRPGAADRVDARRSRRPRPPRAA